MPSTAQKHTERNRQRDRKKDVMISWSFVIPAVKSNSLNEKKKLYDQAYHKNVEKSGKP